MCDRDTKAQPAKVPEGLNPTVIEFAKAMQFKLEKNKHKDGPSWPRSPDGSRNGWADCSIEFLCEKLREEVGELLDAIERRKIDKDEIRHEAADVGNIAMMLADVSGALTAAPAAGEGEWTSCSVRMPTRTDEDHYGKVIFWDAEHDQAVLDFSPASQYPRYKSYTHWMPTGLRKPTPPTEDKPRC